MCQGCNKEESLQGCHCVSIADSLAVDILKYQKLWLTAVCIGSSLSVALGSSRWNQARLASCLIVCLSGTPKHLTSVADCARGWWAKEMEMGPTYGSASKPPYCSKCSSSSRLFRRREQWLQVRNIWRRKRREPILARLRTKPSPCFQKPHLAQRRQPLRPLKAFLREESSKVNRSCLFREETLWKIALAISVESIGTVWGVMVACVQGSTGC